VEDNKVYKFAILKKFLSVTSNVLIHMCGYSANSTVTGVQ